MKYYKMQLCLAVFMTILMLTPIVQAQETQVKEQQAVLAPAPDLKQEGIKWINFKEIPNWHQGFAYSAADSNFNYLSTIEIAKWDAFALEGGYAGRAENTGDKAVLALSVNLVDLSGIVKFPILDKLEFRPAIWTGWGNLGNFNNAEFDWGVGATFVNLKW